MANYEEVPNRAAVFQTAKELVDPVVNEHGLQDYSTGQLFNTSYKTTKVDQHLDHILKVSDWLIGEE